MTLLHICRPKRRVQKAFRNGDNIYTFYRCRSEENVDYTYLTHAHQSKSNYDQETSTKPAKLPCLQEQRTRPSDGALRNKRRVYLPVNSLISLPYERIITLVRYPPNQERHRPTCLQHSLLNQYFRLRA